MARGFAKQVNAMGQYNETYEIEAAILANLEAVMEGQIAEDAKTAIVQATLSKVYMAYDPKFMSRRWHNDGLADPNNYKANYDPSTRELVVTVEASWQNIGFIKTTGIGTGGNDFADVIEKNGMYNAPPRPFIQQAENNIKSIKSVLEATIADHLNKTV